MTQKLIGVVLIIAVLLGLKELHRYWEEVKAKNKTEQESWRASPYATPAPVTPPGGLSGMPPNLETSLQDAKAQGPAALKLWIDKHRPYVKDPRLADIELDYVLLLGARNFTDAKKLFASIKQRTPTNSPVYPRIQQLQRNYE
jgi:hypothetical protein